LPYGIFLKNWVNFGGPWNGKGLVHFMALWNIFLPFGTFYGHLEYITAIWYILWPLGSLAAIWYIFHHLGTLCQEKSGNPVLKTHQDLALHAAWFNFSKTLAPIVFSSKAATVSIS
jgi:hypothetical protein